MCRDQRCGFETTCSSRLPPRQLPPHSSKFIACTPTHAINGCRDRVGKGTERNLLPALRPGSRGGQYAHENRLQLCLLPVLPPIQVICINCYEATEACSQDFTFKIILTNRYAVPRETVDVSISHCQQVWIDYKPICRLITNAQNKLRKYCAPETIFSLLRINSRVSSVQRPIPHDNCARICRGRTVAPTLGHGLRIAKK